MFQDWSLQRHLFVHKTDQITCLVGKKETYGTHINISVNFVFLGVVHYEYFMPPIHVDPQNNLSGATPTCPNVK